MTVSLPQPHSRPAAGPTFRTSPSAIARYFFHDCERFLRYHSASPARRAAEGLPTPEFDHNPLIKALLESGHVWEKTVLEEFLGARAFISPGQGEPYTRRFDWPETVRLLREAEAGTLIYQPTLRLPRGFYERYGIDPELVVLSDNHPDLIAIQDGGNGRRVLRVIDVKRGAALRLTHRIQVLLYALELESIVWAESIAGLHADVESGEVWLGAQPAPTPFDLTELRPHLEHFLRHDLSRILRGAAADARWHVHFRCEWCEFFEPCRDQMRRENDLSRLTHLTAHGKQFLRGEAQVRNVPELGEFLARPDADEVLARCASLAGRRPRLAQQVSALETQQPRAHGAASPSLSKGENIGLFITLQQEPLGRSIYLAAIHLTVRKDLRSQVFSAGVVESFFQDGNSQTFVLLARDPADGARIRRQWVAMLHEIVTQVDYYNQGRSWSDQLSLQTYVLTEQERGLLVAWLLESLHDAEQPQLAEQAMALLFYFQAPELMVADSHPDREVPFPVVVILDALGHVLALPVEVSYTLPEALQALGSRFRYNRRDFYHFPLGHGLRAEPIHAAWRRGRTELFSEIEAEARVHLRALRELLQAIRRHAADAIFAWTARFSLPTGGDYADPLLSRLAFFARYESLLACLAGRHARCETLAAQFLQGKVMELRAVSGNEFDIVSGAAMPVNPGGFPEWLLVTNDDAGRRAQLEYRDYACRSRLWQGKPQSHLAVVGVNDLQRDRHGMPSRLSIEYAKPFADREPVEGASFLLHPRFTDYSTDGVIQFLQSYSEVADRLGVDELFLRLLRDPVGACGPCTMSDDVRSFAEQLTGQLQLTDSQAAAYRAIIDRRVVPVWGPPGTGKTHFLAAVILGLAAAHARAGRPFRVLVTAFTHAAIENLLRKVMVLRETLAAPVPRGAGRPARRGKAKGVEGTDRASAENAMLSRMPLAVDLHVAKVKAWHGDDAISPDVVEPSSLPDWLATQPHAVVGATAHALLKVYGKLAEFDLVVIDEASQVRVPEAAAPISLAGRAGRLVLAGDHLQLPPIINGVYPEPLPGQPLLHRSLFEMICGDRSAPVADVQSTRLSELASIEVSGTADSAVHGTLAAPAGGALPQSPPGANEGRVAYGLRGGVAAGIQQLTENFRMNQVLTSFAAGLLYGPCYRPFDESVTARRLNLAPERCLDPFVESCLDPKFPLVVVMLDGIWAARENRLEASLVAKLVTGLRGTLRGLDGQLYADDRQFFRTGVFLVSPHRAQIRLIERELRQQRMWQHAPYVDTVDKMQGQEADAVLVSYGVSDPEFAIQEAEFIYGLNRLNVAVTRARAKCVVFLPRPLLEAAPEILERPAAVRGRAFMRDLVAAVSRCGETRTFELDDGARAVVYRTGTCFRPAAPLAQTPFEDEGRLREWIDDSGSVARPNRARGKRRSTGSDAPRPPASPAAAPCGVKPCGVMPSGDAPNGGVVRGEARGQDSSGSNAVELDQSSGHVPSGPKRRGTARRSNAARPVQPSGIAAASDHQSPCVGPSQGPSPLVGGIPEREVPAMLAQLNAQQRDAAQHGHEPLLIVAGAGTGKTTTLVRRVAYLISRGIRPQRVLLLTFTRRAAAEMLQRVADVLGQHDVGRGVWGGTFHAIGTRLLRLHGRAIGVDPRFSIHDRGDAESLMQSICQKLNLAHGDKRFPKKGTCMSIHSYMANAEMALPEVLEAQFSSWAPYAGELQDLFAAYARQKAELNTFDYDDLLVKWCELLESDAAGPQIRERFDCVLVDEYQDTNQLQSRLLQGLCPAGRGLTVVGDDAQSIYSFRAATVRNMLDFPTRFPGTRIVKLEQNYRSTRPILAASNRVIAEARERYTKDLRSDRVSGSPPQLITCDDEHEQVDFIVQRIIDHRRRGIPLSEQAVLFRSAHHSILLEAELARQDLPFVKYGGLKFVESAHVKDLTAFLRLAENPRDRVAGQRVLTLLPGVGPKKAEQLQQTVIDAGGNFAAWADVKSPAKVGQEWTQLVSLMRHLADADPQRGLAMQLQSALVYYGPLMDGRYDNLPYRYNDLEELQRLASKYDDRTTMLAELALDPPDDSDTLPAGKSGRDYLVLSTMHSAKGLEWKVVYVLHATDGKIPHERSFQKPEQLEEERRMFYVAMTRAADWLYVCHPRRESSPYGNSWMGNVSEQTTLTRFLSPAAQREFQRQSAGAFQLPGEIPTGQRAASAGRGTRRR